uniref:Uncharacterized protein n=1 Tax=Piliocolobus tephrosceles TaxID=591936 RepID=A0A8C9I477_9PRIM
MEDGPLCSLNSLIIWTLTFPLYDLDLWASCCNAPVQKPPCTNMYHFKRLLCLHRKGYSCVSLPFSFTVPKII